MKIYNKEDIEVVKVKQEELHDLFKYKGDQNIKDVDEELEALEEINLILV